MATSTPRWPELLLAPQRGPYGARRRSSWMPCWRPERVGGEPDEAAGACATRWPAIPRVDPNMVLVFNGTPLTSGSRDAGAWCPHARPVGPCRTGNLAALTIGSRGVGTGAAGPITPASPWWSTRLSRRWRRLSAAAFRQMPAPQPLRPLLSGGRGAAARGRRRARGRQTVVVDRRTWNNVPYADGCALDPSGPALLPPAQARLLEGVTAWRGSGSRTPSGPGAPVAALECQPPSSPGVGRSAAARLAAVGVSRTWRARQRRERAVRETAQPIS